MPNLSLPAPTLAPLLLGCILRVDDVAVRLTEVEAYAGAEDPASHAFRGPTPRTRVMFGPAGHLYVYRCMGIHSCINVVCGADRTAAAVLLRAGEIVGGIEIARARRGGVPDVRLARGPGCLGQALGLTVADSGIAIDGCHVELTDRSQKPDVACGPRVGVSRAAGLAWRFWIDGEPTVSAYRRTPGARDN